ncbi:MAG: PAS domain S-box protein [Thermodesulfobacteriota bacterium]
MSEKDQTRERLLSRMEILRRRVAELETVLHQIAAGCNHVLQSAEGDSAAGNVVDFGWWTERVAMLKGLDVPDVSTLSPENLSRLIRELQVSQVEVKMQNSELRQVHEELKQARDKYVTLYDSAPVGYFTLSKEGLILEANLTGAHLLGRPRDSLIRTPFSSYVAKDSYGTYYWHLKQVFTGKSREVCEIDVERVDGSRFPARLESAPAAGEDTRLQSCRTVISDISALKRAEQALRESEELHRVTLASISDTVLITDRAGNFTYICPNVHVIFGYSSDEVNAFGKVETLVGRDLFDPHLLEQSEEIENIERRITDKFGQEHILLINIKKVSIKGGSVLYSCRDITARKKAEEALALSIRDRSAGESEALGQ